MGEAERRNVADPNHKGLVVSAPLEIDLDVNGVYIEDANLDTQELRSAILFWDKLVWPLPAGVPAFDFLFGAFGPNQDEEFLEQANILSVLYCNVAHEIQRPLTMSECFCAAHFGAFQVLDREEPGIWSLAQGEKSLFVKNGLLDAGGGYELALHRALPVPDKDVPLSEILEFKRRRSDEMKMLRVKIDEFLSIIEYSDDKSVAVSLAVQDIDNACSDAIRVSREWKFPVRLSNLRLSFEARPFVSIGTFLTTLTAAQALHLNSTTALLAALGASATASGSFLKLSADLGWRGLRPRRGPFRYVADYHNEIF